MSEPQNDDINMPADRRQPVKQLTNLQAAFLDDMHNQLGGGVVVEENHVKLHIRGGMVER